MNEIFIKIEDLSEKIRIAIRGRFMYNKDVQTNTPRR